MWFKDCPKSTLPNRKLLSSRPCIVYHSGGEDGLGQFKTSNGNGVKEGNVLAPRLSSPLQLHQQHQRHGGGWMYAALWYSMLMT